MTITSTDFKTRQASIEKQARFIQIELWNLRYELWSADVPTDPLRVLEPGIALRLKGFTIQTVATLGEENICGRRTEIAGMIDRSRRIVEISSRFGELEKRFTAGHELGHAVLHPHGSVIHRDRPVNHTVWQKDPEETEANYFSACFLMPEKQVRACFEGRFLADTFVLNDDTSYALCMKQLDAVRARFRVLRDVSMTVATANRYDGRHFSSLAQLFRVSPTAMAIRLEQLGLVVAVQEKRQA